MVNTNDFRRYSYSSDASYAVDAFNKTRSSAAPQLNPEKKKGFNLRPNTKLKSRKELIADQKKAFVKAASILTVTALCVSMLFGVLYTYVQKNELTRSIAGIKTDIAAAESENVSLNSQLEALVSVSQIDAYAVEKSGMTRLRSNQIQYIDSSEYKTAAASSESAE
ncbi:MAG: hypothetical protein LIO43_06225 [Clostridiales bacterium]|nr:hypothetical protein [Clostridiales bacterium]